MCGIIALSARGREEANLGAALRAMAYRGPDDFGIWRSSLGDCQMGHVRLSIIDLSPSGSQPMMDSSGRYVLSYNGEVYNHQELRHELEKKHGGVNWRGSSDSEVIIEGFARDGVAFLDRLNGMFALVIYDRQERVLHVLRDPIGIKPLFVTEQNDGVWFSSEISALTAIPELRFSLRSAALAEQLAFMYVPEPNTPLKEVAKVEPGICFNYREGRLVGSTKLYKHLYPQSMLSDEDEAVEALQVGLAAAVRRQVVADVPVSLFLSGGLDSSAVAWHAAQAGAVIKDAYTIAFSKQDLRFDAQGDDLFHAQLMAKQLGIELKVITAEPHFLGALPKLAAHMADGFSDPAAINTYLISAGARENGIRVLLSGQGADEYLGGYRRYVAERHLASYTPFLRRLIAAMRHVLPVDLPGPLNSVNRRLRRLALLANLDGSERMMAMYTWAAPETASGLLTEETGHEAATAFEAHAQRYEKADVVDTMLGLDQHYDLMSLNLCYTDRMSMAASVETRVPFLDFDLVRTMNAIPARMKVKGRVGKHVLRRAMSPMLPREIVHRDKAGFGLPIRAWLKDSSRLLDDWLEPGRLAQQGVFKPAAVQRIREEQAAGREDHSYTLLTLLTQQMWLERYHLA